MSRRRFLRGLSFILLACLLAGGTLHAQNQRSDPAGISADRLEEFRIVLTDGYEPNDADIAELAALAAELEAGEDSMRIAEARMLLAVAKDKMDRQAPGNEDPSVAGADVPFAADQSLSSRRSLGIGLTLGSSLASFGLFNAFSYMADIAYGRYVNTTSSRNALVLQRAWMMYDILSYVFLGTGILSFGAAFPFFLMPGGNTELAEQDPVRLAGTRDTLNVRLLRAENNIFGWRTLGGIGIGAGITALAGAGISIGFMEAMQARYISSEYSEDAEAAREMVSIFANTALWFGIAAATGLTTAAFTAILPADRELIEYRIDKIDTALRVEGGNTGEEDGNEYFRTRILELEQLRGEYQERLDKAIAADPAYDAVFFTGLSVGTVSLIAAGISLWLGVDRFDSYSNAPSQAEADRLYAEVEIADLVAGVSAIIGAAGLTTSIFTAALRPKEKRLQEEVRLIDAKILDYRERIGE